MLHALLFMAFASTATVAEPNTGVTFDTAMEVGKQTLYLTGVDRRRAMGRNAYAVAHYVAEVLVDQEANSDTRLSQYIETSAHKVLVFHGIYKSVPAHGIRHSWKKHFKALGVPAHDEFVAAFQAPFARGERLYFIAAPEGRLEVRHNGQVIGQWDDPNLVRAVWAMCLGPTTEIVDREQLVAREPGTEKVAEREIRKVSARP